MRGLFDADVFGEGEGGEVDGVLEVEAAEREVLDALVGFLD